MKTILLITSFISTISIITVINIDLLLGIMLIIVAVMSFICFLFEAIQDYNLAQEYPNLCGKRIPKFMRKEVK
tara:strand:- start:1265 stop:1483 length:219 start_codon:yes stop_codon:yes gene_type:complete